MEIKACFYHQEVTAARGKWEGIKEQWGERQRLKDHGGERWIHHPQMKTECPVSPDSPSEGLRSSRGFLGHSPAGGQAEQSGQFGMCSWSWNTAACFVPQLWQSPGQMGQSLCQQGILCSEQEQLQCLCSPEAAARQPLQGSYGGPAVRSWRYCVSRNLCAKGKGRCHFACLGWCEFIRLWVWTGARYSVQVTPVCCAWPKSKCCFVRF